MKCEQVILYASDELSPTDKTAFEMHLQQCNKCQAHLKLLRGLEETAQAKIPSQAVVDKLFTQTTRRPRRGYIWKSLLAATAMSVLVVGYFVPTITHQHMQQEIVAYVRSHGDVEYQNFEKDLALFEQEF